MNRKALLRILRWLPLVVVVVEFVLVVTGVVDLADAVTVVLVLEALLAVVVVAELAAAQRGYRSARRRGATGGAAISAALDAALPPVVAFLVKQEFRVFGSLVRKIRRRPDIPAGATALPYGASMRPLLWCMIVVSIIEVAVVELIVPWPTVRWILVILGVYGLIWVLGFAASLSVQPHTLSPVALRLRFGFFADVAIPAELLVSARRNVTSGHRHTVDRRGDELAVSVMGYTDVAVELAEPYTVDLGRKGSAQVSRVQFQADDPAGAIAMINEIVALRSALPRH
jgi:hypothetical protein